MRGEPHRRHRSTDAGSSAGATFRPTNDAPADLEQDSGVRESDHAPVLLIPKPDRRKHRLRTPNCPRCRWNDMVAVVNRGPYADVALLTLRVVVGNADRMTIRRFAGVSRDLRDIALPLEIGIAAGKHHGRGRSP